MASPSSNNDETELLLLIAKGDEAAFTFLFNNYHHALGSHIYAITKSREITEEIVQDTFLKVWMCRETLTEIKNIKAYLFIISRNAAISAFRKALRESTHFREWQTEMDTVIIEPDDWKYKERYLSIIDQAIEALHPKRKKVYLLSRKKGLTYEQIAYEMGISKHTVRSHIQQATIAITKFIKDNADINLNGALLFFSLLF